MINLIGNATKFTLKGGITLGLKKDPDYDDKLQMYVRDTGVGIHQKDLKNLFTMYGKLDDPLAINKKGCGLGLTSYRWIRE